MFLPVKLQTTTMIVIQKLNHLASLNLSTILCTVNKNCKVSKQSLSYIFQKLM